MQWLMRTDGSSARTTRWRPGSRPTTWSAVPHGQHVGRSTTNFPRSSWRPAEVVRGSRAVCCQVRLSDPLIALSGWLRPDTGLATHQLLSAHCLNSPIVPERSSSSDSASEQHLRHRTTIPRKLWKCQSRVLRRLRPRCIRTRRFVRALLPRLRVRLEDRIPTLVLGFRDHLDIDRCRCRAKASGPRPNRSNLPRAETDDGQK